MCGNFFSDPIGTVGNAITDFAQNPWPILGTVAGAYFGGPIGAAIGDELGDFASQGPSNFIKNAGSNAEGAALAGATSYGLGQGGSAFSSAFPETSAAINSYIPNIPNLGIGDTINSAEQSLGLGGSVPTTGVTPTDASGATANPAAPSNVPENIPSAGVSGGGAAGGASAPAGVIADPSSIGASDLGQGGYVDNTGQLSQVGTAASSPSLQSASNAASGTVGTQGVGDTTLNAPASPTISSTLNSLNPFSASTDPLAAANGIAPGAANLANSAAADNAGGFAGYANGASGGDYLSNGAGVTSEMPSNVQSALSVGSPSLQSAAQAAAGGGGSAPTAGSGAGAGVKPPNSIGQLFQPGGFTGSNVLSALDNNIGPLAAAGGIGLDALRGTHETAAEKAIAGQASALGAQGQQLENYLQTGTLPAGEQAGVNQSLQSAIASIKSRYASMGMSGSSAEQQDIANAQQQAQAASAQMQEQLLSTGINETGMSAGLYNELLKSSMANDTNLSGAIANFASAAAGGGNFGKGGQTITIGGTS